MGRATTGPRAWKHRARAAATIGTFGILFLGPAGLPTPAPADPLRPGTRIRVTHSAGTESETEGILQAATRDSLFLRGPDTTAAVAVESVASLAARSGSAGRGAVAGGVAGLFAGALVGVGYAALLAWDDDVSATTTAGVIAGGAVAGSLVGAGIGAMIGDAVPHWEEVCSTGKNPCPAYVRAGLEPDVPPGTGPRASPPGETPTATPPPRATRLASVIVGPTFQRSFDEGAGGFGARLTLLLPQSQGPGFGPEIAVYGFEEHSPATHLGLAIHFPIGHGAFSGYGIGGPGLYIFPYQTFGGVNAGGGLNLSLGSSAALTGELRGHWSLPSSSSESFRMATLLLGFTLSW